jgi:hypothetical protein
MSTNRNLKLSIADNLNYMTSLKYRSENIVLKYKIRIPKSRKMTICDGKNKKYGLVLPCHWGKFGDILEVVCLTNRLQNSAQGLKGFCEHH